jgi:hypothetical protein
MSKKKKKKKKLKQENHCQKHNNPRKSDFALLQTFDFQGTNNNWGHALGFALPVPLHFAPAKGEGCVAVKPIPIHRAKGCIYDVAADSMKN